jgi:quercetin dioxygenase-like cupin family protein
MAQAFCLCALIGGPAGGDRASDSQLPPSTSLSATISRLPGISDEEIQMQIRHLFALLPLVCSGLVMAQDKAASAPLPTVNKVMVKPLPEYPGKEALMLTVEFPPGGADPVHRHDAHGFIYVLEGSIVMAVAGGKEVTLTPGQSFYEGPEDVHTVGRNASQDKPAKFVVFLLKDANKPALIPVK